MQGQQPYPPFQGQPSHQSRRKADRTRKPNLHTSFPWTAPAQVAANQQGSITPQQRAMLKRLPSPWTTAGIIVGGYLSFLLFVPSIGLTISQQNNLFLLLFISPLALAVVSLTLRFSRRSRILHAAEAGLIQQVQGEVVWDEWPQRYILHTPTEQLTPPPGDLSLPPPGPYHFFYLTEGKILLSAQPIRTYTQALAYPGTLAETGLSGNEQARLALQQALHHSLGFSPSDLASNREGKLSSTQRRRFTRKLLGKIVGAILGVLFGLGEIVGLCIYAVLQGGSSFFFETSCFSLVGLLVFLSSLFYLLLEVRKEYAGIRRMQVSWVEDHVQAEKHDSDDGCSCSFRIGNLSFDVPCRGCDALARGIRYRVYYLAAMKELVSIEPLEDPLR